MSAKRFHFYDVNTGVLSETGIAVDCASGHENVALSNCPPGHRPIEGSYDHERQRVDLTGDELRVVDYQPPQPSPDHEWNETNRRWQLSQAACDRQVKRRSASAQIAALEASQARPVRELLRDPTNVAARERLDEIDEQIMQLRHEVT
jgi:hypothetical protein